MTSDSLHQAFLDTQYIAHLAPDVTLRIGGSISELLASLPHLTSWAFITAWNPLPEVLTNEQNSIRNIHLKARLNQNGYVIHNGTGISADGTWAEESFLIENITQAVAYTIAKNFRQLAFVYGNREQGNELIYVNRSEFL